MSNEIEATERKRFEAWAVQLPHECSIERFGDDETISWPGQYMHIYTQLAWEAWLYRATNDGKGEK